MIRSFKDLEVYKNSKNLYEGILSLIRTFPKDAAYLSNQLVRAANSVHANIAEGFGRSDAEFRNYLTRALGSANEMLSHLDDAERANYGSTMELQKKYDILGKQLYRLREHWNSEKGQGRERN